MTAFLPALWAGGAERATLTIAEELARRGHEVDLVVAHERPDAESLPPPGEGVRLMPLRRRRTAAALPALAAYLRDRRPVGLLAAITHANLIALAAARLARTDARVVVVEHTDLEGATRGARSRRVRATPLLVRAAYPRAAARLAVSDGVADALARRAGLPRESIDVLPNPVDAARVRALAEAPLDDPWWWQGAGPVFVAVGRLVPAKDFGTLLRAFAAVRRARPCRLAIIGEGPERATLERLVAELGVEGDAALIGHRANPYPYVRAAAAFVMSSVREGLPTALIEALLLGVPAVATDCPSGVREVMAAAGAGRLVAPGDVEGLAAGLAEALQGGVPAGAGKLEQRVSPERIGGRVEQLLLGCSAPERTAPDVSGAMPGAPRRE